MANQKAFCMSLSNYRVLFIVITSIIALLVASPALQRLLVYPRTEFFTELWLLGPEHKAQDYPSNVTSGKIYSIYFGIANHLGNCAYYAIEVKFRNESMPRPTSFGPIENRTPSGLPSYWRTSVFVADESLWELPVGFSLNYTVDLGSKEVLFHELTFNGVASDLSGLTSAWNVTGKTFYGNLLFELWLYDSSISDFAYHGRFVDLRLNITG